MGALTNEINAFKYRAWENDLSVEIDDTEIIKHRIRLEKAKIKRVRYLPINYWISNGKRFKQEQETILLNILKISKIGIFKIKKLITERKKTHIILNTKEIYANLLKFILYNTQFIYFTARQIKSYNIEVYNDLLLYFKKQIRNRTKLINKEEINENIILLTNTRLESPDLNAYLHTNGEGFTFTSFSFFISSFSKDEIPFSDFNIIKAFSQGLYSILNTTIITSLFTFCYQSLINVFYLSPIYISSTPYYPKNLMFSNFTLFSYKNFDLFFTPFISINFLLSSSITIPFDSTNPFDNFVLKKITHKLLYRFFLLSKTTKQFPNKK